MKFSVTSVMLPHLDLPSTCALLEDLGFDGLELRVRRLPPESANEEPSPWGRHLTNVSPENLLDRSDEIGQTLSEHNLQLTSFAAACYADDLEHIRLLSEGAKVIGAPAFRIGCRGYNGTMNYHDIYAEAVEQYGRALEVTREFGVKVVVEMHGGTIQPSASLAHRIVSNFDASDIGVIYDPQNMVKDGFETIPLAIELLGDYLAHVHVGAHAPSPGDLDEQGTRHWNWSACSLAEGLYDFPKMMECLRNVDYEGFISIEDFRGGLTPEERLKEGIEYLKRIAQ